MKKNIIKLNESQLQGVIKNSVKKMLREWDENSYDEYDDSYDEDDDDYESDGDDIWDTLLGVLEEALYECEKHPNDPSYTRLIKPMEDLFGMIHYDD